MSDLGHLPQSDHAIRALHSEIEKLASTYTSPTPIRTEQQGECTLYWFYDGVLKVFVCDGGVFMSGDDGYTGGVGGERFNWWPDWCALRRDEVRAIAHAMLSAAAFVGTDDPHVPRDAR